MPQLKLDAQPETLALKVDVEHTAVSPATIVLSVKVPVSYREAWSNKKVYVDLCTLIAKLDEDGDFVLDSWSGNLTDEQAAGIYRELVEQGF